MAVQGGKGTFSPSRRFYAHLSTPHQNKTKPPNEAKVSIFGKLFDSCRHWIWLVTTCGFKGRLVAMANLREKPWTWSCPINILFQFLKVTFLRTSWKKQNLVLLCPTSMKAIQIGWYSCLDRSHRIVCELYELGVNFKQIGLDIVPRMKLKFIFGLLFLYMLPNLNHTDKKIIMGIN